MRNTVNTIFYLLRFVIQFIIIVIRDDLEIKLYIIILIFRYVHCTFVL